MYMRINIGVCVFYNHTHEKVLSASQKVLSFIEGVLFV